MLRGGRFWHFSGGCDKGLALSVLIGFYRVAWQARIITVALGDGGNDLSMLRLVDRPILMPKPDGHFAEERQQTGRWPVGNDIVQVSPVGLLWSAPVCIADAPVHAPTAPACAFITEEIFQSGPRDGANRFDGEFQHAQCMSQLV